MKNKTAYIITGLLMIVVQAAIDNFLNTGMYIDIALFLFIPLLAPYRINTIVAMVTAFLLGLCVDAFGNGIPGMTAGALAAMALFRKSIISLTISEELLEKENAPSIGVLGMRRFLLYAVPQMFIFFIVYILMDCAGFTPFWHNLLRLCISVAINTVIMALLFISSRDRRK